MSQLFQLDFFLKNQACVDTFTDFINRSRTEMAADGYEEIARYVNQDDPHHLIFLVQWTSREHHAVAMKKMFAQPEISEMLEAVFADQPCETWLDKLD